MNYDNMNIQQMYQQQVGRLFESTNALHDLPDGEDIPVRSECGEMCAEVITNAGSMLRKVQFTLGDDGHVEARKIAEVAQKICTVLICG